MMNARLVLPVSDLHGAVLSGAYGYVRINVQALVPLTVPDARKEPSK